LIALLWSPPALAQGGLRLAEQDIKAGLLYNFLRYTQWPEPSRPDQPAVVCIYGRDPFGGRLSGLAGRTVNQRTIEVRSVRNNSDFDACSLLVLNAEEREQWPQLRNYLSRRNVLTVSDYDTFTMAGGMIEFTRVNSRIGVRINIEAVKAADLAVQDRLLRLASPVRSNVP
jgi:hypothetical protein